MFDLYLPSKSRDKILIRLAALSIGQYRALILLAFTNIEHSNFVRLSTETHGHGKITLTLQLLWQYDFVIHNYSRVIWIISKMHFKIPSMNNWLRIEHVI